MKNFKFSRSPTCSNFAIVTRPIPLIETRAPISSGSTYTLKTKCTCAHLISFICMGLDITKVEMLTFSITAKQPYRAAKDGPDVA